MSKGQKHKNSLIKYTDEFTGKRVTKLTPERCVNHHQYFYNKMFTSDSNYLIYGSDRDGNRNLYKMNIINGDAVQLTEGNGINDFGSILSNDDKYLFFTRNNTIYKMNLDTLDEVPIYQEPKEWSSRTFDISDDNRFIAMTQIYKKDIIEGKGDWSSFEPQWRKKPLCRIVYFDIENNKGNVILEQNCWFGHPQIRPGNNDTILFCHEGPGNLIDARLWLINSDGSNRRCAREKSENELVTTHEFWLRDGSKFGFMYREKDQKTFLKFINPDTLEENTLMECSHYLHFISNREGSMITGDGDSFIYIIDVANKKEEKLCFHGSHWKSYGNTQDSHPHPCFTPDSMSVLFTSDKDGLPSIYKVDL